MPGADRLRVSIDRKTFPGRTPPVLEHVRFDAERGNVLALLAPSGTGKTTALKILLGLDSAFEGSVQRPPGRLGAVFQEPRLLPWATVEDNIRLVAPELTPTDLAALLAAMDLPGVAGLRPRQISLGMARRVSLARALAVAPALLVLDEPFASLDARLGARLCEVVALQARAHGAIVVMASHDLEQAMTVADRLLLLAGRPATLAAGFDVPAPPGRAALAARIRADFPFLDETAA